MRPGAAIFFWLLLLSGGVVALTLAQVRRLTTEHKRRELHRWLAGWLAKGIGMPVVIWGLMNIGLGWQLQPYMPQVQAAQNSGGNWFQEFLRVTGYGVFVVSSAWCALTLGWVLTRYRRELGEEGRHTLVGLCWTCFLAGIVPAVIMVLVGGWPMVGLAGTLVLALVAGYAPGVVTPAAIPPIYARAIARMKMGKYDEAELEIIRQLESCEDDYEGWMMLAELYATHFQDITEAEQTILGLCGQPGLTTGQLSVALHKLADWQLKLAGDPAAARRALQMICDRLRGTHLARMAQLRISHLPKTVAELKEQQTAAVIPLPALGDHFDETPQETDPKEAAKLANECVGRLKLDPNDVTAREKLARIFAESMGRADLGIEQLCLLLDLPDQSAARQAEWLGRKAAWQVRYLADTEGGKQTLERLIELFPESPQAFAARYRLKKLEAPSAEA